MLGRNRMPLVHYYEVSQGKENLTNDYDSHWQMRLYCCSSRDCTYTLKRKLSSRGGDPMSSIVALFFPNLCLLKCYFMILIDDFFYFTEVDLLRQISETYKRLKVFLNTNLTRKKIDVIRASNISLITLYILKIKFY